MSKSTPGIPSSSVLDRVKLFLPQIDKANKELEEKIKTDGAKSVQIDTGLAPQQTKSPEKIIGESECLKPKEAGEQHEVEAADADNIEDEDPSSRVVSLEFALGDFDDTAIAKAMDDAEDGNEKRDTDDLEVEEEEDGNRS